MAHLYPPAEPYDHGLLDVGDGHRIYWETSGNPAGEPVVALHGGPGSGMGSGRSFDPGAYLLVRFDQRGCGRSTPSAADLSTDLSTNTTHHLIADIEKLREYLGIDRWLVWGGSWGVTLGLAYAERFPERVSEMVLMSVTMTRPQDVHWLYHEVGRYFPQEWAVFSEGGGRAADLVAAYDRLLNHSADAAVRANAARNWRDWEDAVLSLEEGWTPSPRYLDPDVSMMFARLCAHYFMHAAWLGPDELLENAHRLAGIRAVLIHGRLDLGGPADVPWMLARAWPGAELHFFGAGHTGSEEARDIMITALDRFART